MYTSILTLGLFSTIVSAAATPPLLRSRQSTSCSTPSGPGYCGDTDDGCSGGTFYSGYCSGASNIQCCVTPCTTSDGSGYCQDTSTSCSGTFESGYCPGSSSNQCCVGGSGGGGGSTGSGSLGVDISDTPSSSFWSCAASTYSVVALRGYQQACGSGGQVASNFLSMYNSAVSAGVQRIDAYLFPCTGTQPTGVTCKDPSTQLNEFLTYISDNSMQLGTLWFDIEPTSGVCNAWNLGASANTALAQQWVGLLQNSGMNWGIYANGNQWSDMFGSRDTDVGSSLPLWAVQDDMSPGVDTVTTFMGGWTTASAKQYNLDTTGCGASVDLDSFS